MHRHSRRGFLRWTLGGCWIGASLLDQAVLRAAQARAQLVGVTDRLFDIEKVADGVYAAVARPAALTNSNAAIFVNSNDVLIVDTHSKPSAAAALAAQLRKEITPKPIRYIVNSHFHWDHTQGAPAYRKIAPQADLVASTATRRLLAELGTARLKASVEQARKTLEEHKAKLGAAGSAAEKAYHERMVREIAAYVAEMQNYAPELPDVTVDGELVIHDKAHELHLAFRGRGHTAGDIVVWCPQKKVIASGDLLHGFLPFIGDGYPKEWPTTLYALAGFEFQHVIGGHGGVQHTRDRLYHMAAYIEELTEQVARGRRGGRGLDELQRSIAPATVKSLDRNGYGSFVAESILKHRALPPGTSAADVLTAGVRDNVAQIFTALDRP